MAGEGHLERGREYAHAPHRTRVGRGKNEGRLGKIELKRERLHRLRIETLPVLEHAERISRERGFGEYVDDAELERIGHEVKSIWS